MNERMMGETRAAYVAAHLYMVIGSMTESVAKLAQNAGSDDFKLASQILADYGLPGSERFNSAHLSADTTPAIRTLYDQLNKIGDHIDKLVTMGDALDAILDPTSIPRDRDEITIKIAAAQSEYERAANAVLSVAQQYGNEAVQGPQIKADVVAQLMTPEGGGMARTPAEKAASESPRYREHRERLNGLQQQKAEREDARTIAYTRLESVRLICEVVEHQIRATEQQL